MVAERMAALEDHGLLERHGFARQPDGEWSEEAVAFLEREARQRVTDEHISANLP